MLKYTSILPEVSRSVLHPSEGNHMFDTLTVTCYFSLCIYQCRCYYYHVIIGAYEEITDRAVLCHATVFSQAWKR